MSITKTYFVASLKLCVLLLLSSSMVAQPVAKFSSTVVSGCAPIVVQFNDESTGNPATWQWDLGNGTTSYLQHPSATYINPGQYSITLIVKNALGQDSLTKTSYIVVNAAPVVNFSSSQTNECFAVNAAFSTPPANGIARWQWDFGDGILSSEQQPTHRYTYMGSYNVTLKLTNTNGCVGTLMKPGYINVNAVKAAFATTVASGCNSQRISFNNASTGNGQLQYKWYFGTGDSSTLANPVYSYPQSGTFTVKLVVQNQFGCVDSLRRILTVNGVANASFTADVTKACKAPLTVRFTSTAATGSTYQWDFGDSTVATVANPTHVFTDTGNYTIKLKVRNISGCIDTLTKTNYIQINRPFSSLMNLPDSGCAGLTKQFEADISNFSMGIRYAWNFGDGNTSTVANPIHRYQVQGNYNVSLVLTDASGCSDTTVMHDAIKINSKPTAAFSVNNLTTCAGTEVLFTDLSTGGVNGWEWDFGDNTQGTDQHPRHRFSDTGYLSPRLVAFNGGCTDTLKRMRYVYAKPAVSKFKFEFNCATPFNYSFSNFSIGATSLRWDFGDGVTSTMLNPTHTYRDTGLYEIALTAYNQTTGCTYYRSKKAKVVKLIPNFYASDSALCKGQRVTFTSTVNAADAARFIWDFGDGEQEGAYGNTISHVYRQAGNYTVRLVVINLVNCRDSFTRTGYIRVSGPKAAFALQRSISCANVATILNDSSVATPGVPIRQWLWNYGDGTLDTLSAPPFTHTYTSRGNYRATLKIIDLNGCIDSFRLPLPVTVNQVNPLILSGDTVVCLGRTITMVAPYAEPGIQYSWQLGDGTIANTQTVRHNYTNEGNYTVKMVCTTAAGCVDSATYPAFIKVIEPQVAFTMSDSFRTCPPLIVQFNNESINAAEVLWDFGDGTSTTVFAPSHFYPTAGVYIVTLTIKGRGGCVKQMKREIVVMGPKGTISYGPLQHCNPGPVNLVAHTVDAVSYIWDFNDGTTLMNTDSGTTHVYSNPGNYVPRLLLADLNGCRVAVSGADTLRIAKIAASFTQPSAAVCDNDTARFVNTSISTEPMASVKWSFGDGNTAVTPAQAAHQFAPGTYYPSIIITAVNGCIDSMRSALPITVIASPLVDFQQGSNGCVPLATSFAAQSTGNAAVTNWQWDFGNDQTSNQQQPPLQLYNAAGSYTVRLTATADNGCKRMVERTFSAWPLPAVRILGSDSICSGSSTLLSASGAHTYVWSALDTVPCITCASNTVQPTSNSQYFLTGVSQQGCAAQDSILVHVVQPVQLTVANKSICIGKSTALQATGASTYQWSLSDGSGELAGASPVVQPAVSTTYRVVAGNNQVCAGDTAYATVEVNALPQVDAGADQQVASGTPVDLVPSLSNDVVTVRWTPTGDIFRNSENSITVKPLATTEYTVKATNRAGCTAEDRVLVKVALASDQVYLPNTFSPNMDGINDVFFPRSKGQLKILRLRIINRAGIAVFDNANFYTNEIKAGWDGRYRGVVMETGVYVYAIEVLNPDGNVNSFQGNVSIIR